MKGPTAEALLALHRSRFEGLPFDCGKDAEPGHNETGEWADWSTQSTTPDQLRIERYLDRFDLQDKSLLHIGCGNSQLARRFAGRTEALVGTTIMPPEVELGRSLGLPGYEVLLQNKYSGAGVLAGRTFDFIIDNNPATFACCMSHFATMMQYYADALTPEGQFLTDRVGLAWVGQNTLPQWSLTPEDLAAVAALFGLDTLTRRGDVVVLSGGAAAGPGAWAELRYQSRRAGRLVRRLARRASP